MVAFVFPMGGQRIVDEAGVLDDKLRPVAVREFLEIGRAPGREAEVEVDGDVVEVFLGEMLISLEGGKKGHRVLAAGKADGDPVAFFEEVERLVGLPDGREDLSDGSHGWHSNKKLAVQHELALRRRFLPMEKAPP